MKKLWAFLTFFTLASYPGNVYAAQPINLYDAGGNPIGSTLSGGKYYLNVNASLIEAATAIAGAASPAVVKVVAGLDGGGLVRPLLTDNTGSLQITTSNPSVGATGAAVPASANFMGVKSGANLVGLTYGQALMAASLPVTLASDQSPLAVTQSGNWDIRNITGTVSLPTGASTAAKQPALGVAGTASADVITVQGIASMTALKTDGSGVTQPVSGTVTANQGTANATPWNDNVAQINGVAPLMGNGVTGTGSQRVTIASDNSAISVNSTLQAGAAIVGKVGIDQTTPGTTNGVQVNAALPAGANLLGKTGIDQTTPGTTNAVAIAQIGANTVLTGNGVTGTGSQRVTIASDNTAFPVNATLQAGSAIAGKFGIDQTTPGTTNLVSIGTNGTVAINAAIPAGTNLMGKVGIDQTTPGTTNGVQVNAALPAGTNVIGKMSIDQTTPGTTNLVSIGTGGTVQEKAPLNSTGSGSAAAATVSTVITLTAPANAVGAHLMNIDTSTANIRWAVNRTATATLGQQLQPGRDVYIQTAHDISLVAESGTQTYDVQWISQ